MAKQKKIKFQDRHGDLRGRQNGITITTTARTARPIPRVVNVWRASRSICTLMPPLP